MLNLGKLYEKFETKLPKDKDLSVIEKEKLFSFFCSVSQAYFDKQQAPQSASCVSKALVNEN